MNRPDEQLQPSDDEALEEFYPPAEEAPTLVLTSPWAVSSFVVGLLSFFLIATPLCLPVAILAVVFGHSARKQIRTGLRGGSSWAMCGLIVGYMVLVARISISIIMTYVS
jgi:hypothetical protein